MKYSTAIALIVLTSAAPVFAGVMPGEDTPFYWETPDGPMAPSVDTTDDAPLDSGDAKVAPVADKPSNRILKDYPLTAAPQNGVPEAGSSAVFEAASPRPTAEAPTGVELVGPDALDEVGSTDAPHRRAPMGADGVIRGVQDNPEAELHRRGGETPASEAGYAHPDEIRRANALGDYRPPIQSVGSKTTVSEEVHDIASDEAEILVTDEGWRTERGSSLRETLDAWSQHAGYQLIWEAPYDYDLTANATIEGSFLDAVGKTLSAFEHATPPIRGAVFPENQVLVISTSNEFSGR
ncbi:toxin co-regulated pilus biosynthesis Q family protein [Tranquillimonas alkanivorans]|uniref:Toxin co-regulated pilus biosynthesis protein Q n=1 Tax=Tranquillimonas alkanivorans TaxID=441119 RepID=A0A1I5V1R4_9RHOB|nr:toxin co-regulated pilus biosynthesis Q family protein [Tranquillimonas alkanivorans]SFQ01419.1 Toxin co-regulated pilus biosynthesis protein Q [Tranquillimonas alkanivorans]